MSTTRRLALAMVIPCLVLAAQTAKAIPFTTSYTGGTSSQTVYVQGFTPSLNPVPPPGSAAGDTVYLSSFTFAKSGTEDGQSNIKLVILNNIFGDLTGLNTSSGLVTGVSSNTLASTASTPLGTPETFNFDNLPLIYGNNYAAMFANIDGGGVITPIRVSALTATYVETPPGSGSFHPVTNYGTESQFNYATSNFITTNSFGSFFNTFSFAGDANFIATLDTVVPEPASLATMLIAAGIVASRRRARG